MPCVGAVQQHSSLLNREVEVDALGRKKRVTLNELKQTLGGGRKVESRDPYYTANMIYRGWPAVDLLAKFGVDPASTELEASFKASDGYEVHLSVRALSEGSAWLVYADEKEEPLPGIGPRRQDAGPLYLIWEGQEHTNLTTHPRPYSIVEVRVEKRREEMSWLPSGSARPDWVAGQASFRTRCVRCHALNQLGGHVGPDLNVPQNILAYRQEADVRAYILNPATFRYGTMPPHPDLVEPELTHLIEFLRAMGQHQKDPGLVSGTGH